MDWGGNKPKKGPTSNDHSFKSKPPSSSCDRCDQPEYFTLSFIIPLIIFFIVYLQSSLCHQPSQPSNSRLGCNKSPHQRWDTGIVLVVYEIWMSGTNQSYTTNINPPPSQYYWTQVSRNSRVRVQNDLIEKNSKPTSSQSWSTGLRDLLSVNLNLLASALSVKSTINERTFLYSVRSTAHDWTLQPAGRCCRCNLDIDRQLVETSQQPEPQYPCDPIGLRVIVWTSTRNRRNTTFTSTVRLDR